MTEGQSTRAEQQESAQLDLSADDRLPWLESDDEVQTTGGVSTRQVVSLLAGLIAVLLLVVGAIWFVANNSGHGAPVPDGSVIAAPEGPIRERPEDPGGREFAGTGNVAPVVGEGGMREGIMAVGDASSEDIAAPDAVSLQQAREVTSADTGRDTSDVGVQLAAYRSRERAEQGWRELRRRTSVLEGVDYRIVRGTVDIGTVYRLQAVRTNREAGDALCAALKADGLDCQVKVKP